MTIKHVVADEVFGQVARRQWELQRRVLEGTLNPELVLSELQRLIEGEKSDKTLKHIIDCDVDPFVPKGWTVEEHVKGGQFEFDPSKVELYLSEGQKDGKFIKGTELRKELKGKPVLNANVLDHLLAHPGLVPENWKVKFVFFWGTIYRSSGGSLYVRCLGWHGDGWTWLYDWLEGGWDGSRPAAVVRK